MNTTETFIARAKALRESHELTQRELVHRLALVGVSMTQPEYSLLEQGKRGLKLDEAAGIARVYGVGVDALTAPSCPICGRA